jgi:hypothetical protein
MNDYMDGDDYTTDAGPVTDWRKRAEVAEARVKEQDALLDMLPEYLEYWGACDGPALSLSEWYVYRNGYALCGQPDDTDAQLILAAIDGEDGDDGD